MANPRVLRVTNHRLITITADDFGIGPETTRGILDLAARGVVTSTVLLVNSPYASDAVALWRALRSPLELGWHPCLTFDRPLLEPRQIPSLVDADGRFFPLRAFLCRLWQGRLHSDDIAAELAAQYERFCRLVGHSPRVVNGHHHLHIFPQVGPILRELLKQCPTRPYLRRVVETWPAFALAPGQWWKRLFLGVWGRRAAKAQRSAGFPGGEQLLGLSGVGWPGIERCLRATSASRLELVCHPGFPDATLASRGESSATRVQESDTLRDPAFRRALEDAGFTLVPAEKLSANSAERQAA